jgi:hypothetical protein
LKNPPRRPAARALALAATAAALAAGCSQVGGGRTVAETPADVGSTTPRPAPRISGTGEPIAPPPAAATTADGTKCGGLPGASAKGVTVSLARNFSGGDEVTFGLPLPKGAVSVRAISHTRWSGALRVCELGEGVCV